MEKEESVKLPIEERVKEYLHNPKAPPIVLGVWQLIWRGMAAMSNIDFIVSVREERVAMILEWLLDWGWILIAVVAAIWAFFAPRKSPNIRSLNWQRVGVVGVIGFMGGVLVTTQGGTSSLNVLQSWGTGPTDCLGQIDTSKLIGFENKDHIVLMCGVSDPKIDPLDDTHIAVSAPFTINGGVILIDAPIDGMSKVIDPLPVGAPFQTWHSVALWPASEDVSEIKSVSDIEKHGGIILTNPKAGGFSGVSAKGMPPVGNAPNMSPAAPTEKVP